MYVQNVPASCTRFKKSEVIIKIETLPKSFVYCFGSGSGLNPVSGSGSKRANMRHEKRKKEKRNLMF
jgi:hypothetical protein